MEERATTPSPPTTRPGLLRRCVTTLRQLALIVSALGAALFLFILVSSHHRSDVISYRQPWPVDAGMNVYIVRDALYIELADLHYILRDFLRARHNVRLFTDEPTIEPVTTAIASQGAALPGYIASIFVGPRVEGLSTPMMFGHTEPVALLRIPLWFAILLTAIGPLWWLWRTGQRAPKRLVTVLVRPIMVVRDRPMTTLCVLTTLLVILWTFSNFRTTSVRVSNANFRSDDGVFLASYGVRAEINVPEIDCFPDRYRAQPNKTALFSTTFISDRVHEFEIGVGYWVIGVVMLSMISATLINRFGHRKIPAGHCQTCAYDLRATQGLCPECGADPALAPDPPGHILRARNWLVALCATAFILISMAFFTMAAADTGSGAKFVILQSTTRTFELSITRWQMDWLRDKATTTVSTFLPISVLLALGGAMFFLLYRSMNAHRAPSR